MLITDMMFPSLSSSSRCGQRGRVYTKVQIEHENIYVEHTLLSFIQLSWLASGREGNQSEALARGINHQENHAMRLIQCQHQGQIHAARVENDREVRLLDSDTYTLARRAIVARQSLAEAVEAALTETRLDYSQLIEEKRLLPPLTHPDPAHCLVTGTGLTHLGSADTRSAMHAKTQVAEAELTDSMRMFKLGVEGGKPQAGSVGAQP